HFVVAGVVRRQIGRSGSGTSPVPYAVPATDPTARSAASVGGVGVEFDGPVVVGLRLGERPRSAAAGGGGAVRSQKTTCPRRLLQRRVRPLGYSVWAGPPSGGHSPRCDITERSGASETRTIPSNGRSSSRTRKRAPDTDSMQTTRTVRVVALRGASSPN